MNLTLIRRMVLLSLFAAFHFHAGAADQAADPIAVDIPEKAASRLFAPKISRIDTRHLDGVKGTTMTSTDSGYAGATREERNRTMRNFVCNAPVFGVVKLEAARSFIGKDDRGVFTRFRFRVLDDWRAAPNRKASVIVHIVMPGGEAKYKGETVRIDNALADYQVNSTYLLMAGTRFNTDDGNVLYDQPPLIEVVDGVLYPAPGSEMFGSGTELSKAKAELTAAVPAGSCN